MPKRMETIFKEVESRLGKMVKEIIAEKKDEEDTRLIRQKRMEAREREKNITKATLEIPQYETNILRRKKGEDSTNYYKKHE